MSRGAMTQIGTKPNLETLSLPTLLLCASRIEFSIAVSVCISCGAALRSESSVWRQPHETRLAQRKAAETSEVFSSVESMV